MRRTFRSLAVGAAAAAALAGVGLMAGGGAAFAAGGGGPTPPWESSISPAPLGLDHVLQRPGPGGDRRLDHCSGLAAYAVASAPYTAATGYNKATLFAYTPVSGQNPGTWSGEGISLSTTFPNASAPAPINGTTPTRSRPTAAPTPRCRPTSRPSRTPRRRRVTWACTTSG